MMIAIMNDCDCLDVRDFEAIKSPWEEAGIPIDWSFFPHAEIRSKKFLSILAKWGRDYKDHQMFTFNNSETVRNYVRSGLLKTIHIPITTMTEFEQRTLLLNIMKAVDEPILTGHGKPRKLGDLWSNFLDYDFISSNFFAISNYGVRSIREDMKLVGPLMFKRLPPAAKDKVTPHYMRLIRQIGRTRGRDAILSTHLAHKYSERDHHHYLEHVQKAINFMCSQDIKVVDVRTFIKLKRRENKWAMENQGIRLKCYPSLETSFWTTNLVDKKC